MADSYRVIVEVERFHSEDDEIVRDNPEYKGLPLAEALRRQLAKELQHACDNGMAGNFHVKEIWES